MTKFTIKEKKTMPKREDGLASTYNKQSRADYLATNQHIQRYWNWILEHAVATNQAEILVKPLKGFPRRGRDNYSAYDLYDALDKQFKRGEDYLDSHIDRWNRLFEDFPNVQVEFEYPQATTTFDQVFA